MEISFLHCLRSRRKHITVALYDHLTSLIVLVLPAFDCPGIFVTDCDIIVYLRLDEINEYNIIVIAFRCVAIGYA